MRVDMLPLLDGLIVLACIIAAGCIVLLAALAALIYIGVKWGKL